MTKPTKKCYLWSVLNESDFDFTNNEQCIVLEKTISKMF